MATMNNALKEPEEIEMADLKGRPSGGGREVGTENESETMDAESDLERGKTGFGESPTTDSADKPAHASCDIHEMDDMQQTTMCSICLAEFGT